MLSHSIEVKAKLGRRTSTLHPAPRAGRIDRRKADEDVAERMAGGVRASFHQRDRADERPARLRRKKP
jgi:hypothetical protein